MRNANTHRPIRIIVVKHYLNDVAKLSWEIILRKYNSSLGNSFN